MILWCIEEKSEMNSSDTMIGTKQVILDFYLTIFLMTTPLHHYYVCDSKLSLKFPLCAKTIVSVPAGSE